MRRTGSLVLAGTILTACTSDGSRPPVPIAAARSEAEALVATLSRTPTIAARLRRPPTRGPKLDVRTPDRSDGALRLAVPWLEGGFVTIAPHVAAPSAAVATPLASVHPDGHGGGLAYVVAADRVEELRVVPEAQRTWSALYRVELGPAFEDLRVHDGVVEIVDRGGHVRIASEPAFVVDARGTERPLRVAIDGEGRARTLRVEGDLAGLVPPIVVDPTWKAVSKMKSKRDAFALVPLGDGKALAIGGLGDFSATHSSVEVFDEATLAWTTRASMSRARFDHAAARLPDGRVLVTGGRAGGAPNATNEAEIYDPKTDTWTAAAPMKLWRAGHMAVTTVSGKVLVVGGYETLSSPTYKSAELYDPATNTWSSAASPTGAYAHTDMVRLDDGRVLVTGEGARTEIWDPVSDTWKLVGELGVARAEHRLVVVPGGKVLAVGGRGPTPGDLPIASAEIFDPASGTWSAAPALTTKRAAPAAARAVDGTIVVTGGYTSDGSTETFLASTEVFDPKTSTWSAGSPLSSGRRDAQTAVLPSGAVVFAGGGETVSVYLASDAADLYEGCAAGVLADGVCCDRACDAPCEACDVAGKVGTCSAIDGAPRPGKTCGAFLCTAGACATGCAGDAECAIGHRCVAGACVKKSALGATCASPAECASGFCADGVCCDTACTGQCESCDVAGGLGTCTPAIGAPRGGRPKCGTTSITCHVVQCDGFDREACHEGPVLDGSPCGSPRCDVNDWIGPSACTAGVCTAPAAQACDRFGCHPETGCYKACATHEQCAPGHVCKDGGCVSSSSATCSEDRRKSVGGDGLETACDPLLCGDDGKCFTVCRTSADCVPGFACDVGSKTCVAAAAAQDEGGCAYGGRARGTGALAIGLVAIVGWLARRRPRRSGARD